MSHPGLAITPTPLPKQQAAAAEQAKNWKSEMGGGIRPIDYRKVGRKGVN